MPVRRGEPVRIDAGRWERLRQVSQFLRLPLQPLLVPASVSPDWRSPSARARPRRFRRPSRPSAERLPLRACCPAVMRVTDRSMAAKAYQATALASAVSAAIPQKARNNLVLTPRTWPAGRHSGRLRLRAQVSDAARVSLGHAPSNLAPPRERLWRRHSPSRSTGLMLPSARMTVRKTRSMPWFLSGP